MMNLVNWDRVHVAKLPPDELQRLLHAVESRAMNGNATDLDRVYMIKIRDELERRVQLAEAKRVADNMIP